MGCGDFCEMGTRGGDPSRPEMGERGVEELGEVCMGEQSQEEPTEVETGNKRDSEKGEERAGVHHTAPVPRQPGSLTLSLWCDGGRGEGAQGHRHTEVIACPLRPVLKVQTPKKQPWDRPVSERSQEREQDRAHTHSEDPG